MTRWLQRAPTRTTVLVLLGALVLSAMSANPALSAASVLLLAALVGLLWRPGEPPALLFAMAYHWVQASILVLDANLRGRPLADMGLGDAVVPATWLTLAGVLAVAVGMRIGAGPSRAAAQVPQMLAMVREFSIIRLFWTTLLAIAAVLLVGQVAYIVPGLTQPLLALAAVRWAVVLVFTYVVFVRHEGYGLLAIVFLVELGIGVAGFFSDFKTVLVVMAIAGAAAPGALRGARFGVIASIAVAVIALGVVWSGVKMEYRYFLNQGTGQQVVLVPVADRMAKLAELVGDLDGPRLATSTQALAQRLSYVDYFGQVLRHVPARLEHTGGQLWGEAISRTLVPRLIDPDKPVIDDSERTSRYIGARVAGAAEGASISLGYIAESYIDFGAALMHLVLLAWGVAVGFAWRTLQRAGPWPLLGHACAAVLVALYASVLEQSNLKMFAAITVGLVVLHLARWLGGRTFLRLTLRPLPRAAGPRHAAA